MKNKNQNDITKRNIYNVDLDTLLKHFIKSDEKIIIAVSHPYKRNLLKNKFKEL
ncbi:MAG: hypothetical protein U9N34_07850 [Candidatus Cloacimonadota bacterium]|nr:hypothetical protein [Candidatus Cloacimonadota bacterium]